SLSVGKVFSDDKVEMALYDRAIGYHYDEIKEEQSEDGMKRTVTTKRIQDNTAAIFWLKNRRPEQWRDKVENDTVQDINIHIDHEALGIKPDES
ncbi:MAG: helix-turn-helix domain-containing protein, partial [Gammaproteobacteria bacterium]|nr:helix-turn-helix domain-containing protein [Gammaproteobacteria bacterium]